VKTIGLTGGIGSGKSTAARLLAELGADVIDADRVGHEVYLAGTQGWQRIVDCFGRSVVGADGEIDRKRLGAIVFADPKRLTELNSIVHPLIREEVRRRIAERRAAQSTAPVVVEAAVLIEAKWFTLVDEVWLVVADRESIYQRIAAQRGLDRSAIEARIGSQLDDDERRRHAQVVIDNSGSEGDLRAALTRLWRERLAPTAGRAG
jgi:dephospho-CoA kinase